MAVMNYETPGLTKIDFEDSLFVTTELDKDENSIVKGYIESRGGIIKNSVTKTTNYLIYKDGEEETTKYKKALELVNEKDLEINILSLEKFGELVTMRYETPDISKIEYKDCRFVATGFYESSRGYKMIREQVVLFGGTVEGSLSTDTDYLIYDDDTWETDEYLKALKLVMDKEAKINIMRLSLFCAAGRVIEIMEFGSYPYEEDGTRKPIRWAVLKKEDSRALLLSVYGIDAKPYNKREKKVTWETCTLRKWLNEDFLDAAFTEEEKKRICLTKVKNPDNPRFKTPGGNDTEDRVFLLSLDEARELLPTDIQRMTAATPYAKKQGAYVGYNGNGWWWLRSPGNDARSAADVNYDGNVSVYGNYVYHSYYAVCPALWIDLES